MTKRQDRNAIYVKRQFDAEIIVLCVRWYITYRLSYRDLVANDGRARHDPFSHDDHAMGDPACSEIREALEPIFPFDR